MPGAPEPERGAGGVTPQIPARRERPDRSLPLFLHRDTYRRRRVMDAARLLPAFGAVLLLLLPVLWDDSHSTASGAVYLFAAWAGLILAAVVLARRLSAPLRGRARSRDGDGDDAGADRETIGDDAGSAGS
ncbi:MAG: DUF6611 family protein [Paracoccaceae bacterium]|nr:DUF6611 family protein [Paracoccaceae bacterium]